MTRRNGSFLMLLAAALAVQACSYWDNPPEISGRIGGFVLTPDSVPVAGSAIHLEFADAACEAVDDDVFVDETTSEADGRYVVHFRSYASFRDPCLRLRALPPPGTAYAASTWVEVDVAPNQDDIRATVDLYLTAE